MSRTCGSGRMLRSWAPRGSAAMIRNANAGNRRMSEVLELGAEFLLAQIALQMFRLQALLGRDSDGATEARRTAGKPGRMAFCRIKRVPGVKIRLAAQATPQPTQFVFFVV